MHFQTNTPIFTKSTQPSNSTSLQLVPQTAPRAVLQMARSSVPQPVPLAARLAAPSLQAKPTTLHRQHTALPSPSSSRDERSSKPCPHRRSPTRSALPRGTPCPRRSSGRWGDRRAAGWGSSPPHSCRDGRTCRR